MLFRSEFTSLAEACNFARELRRKGLTLWHVRIDRPMSVADAGASPRGNYGLTVLLSGTSAAVERSRREAIQLVEGAGGTLEATEWPTRDGPLPVWTSGGDPMTCESSILPTLVPRFVQGIDRVAPGAFLDISPLEASVSMTWLGVGPDEERVRRVHAIASQLGGSLLVLGCDPELKKRIDVFGDPPLAFELMRRVKQQFDPNGILSPGRFVGRL